MFQTNSQILAIIGDFAVIGFILGFLYDIVRFFRKALGLGRIFTFVTDFLSMIFSGLVLLFFALDRAAVSDGNPICPIKTRRAGQAPPPLMMHVIAVTRSSSRRTLDSRTAAAWVALPKS